MKVFRRSVLILLILVLGGPLRADLTGDIQDILKDKLLQKSEAAVHVVRLDGSARPKSLVRIDADKPLIPASNLKLITTAAALHTLGADFKFSTQLLLHDGDLVVRSDGDPTIGDVELLKTIGWSVDTTYQGWAEQIKHLNLPEIRDVIVDDSVFDEQFMHPRWPMNQAHRRYAAQVAAVNLNANCLDVLVHPTSPGRIVTYTLTPDTGYVTVGNTCVTGNENAIWLSRKPGTNEIVLRGQTISSVSVPVSVTIHDAPLYAGTVLRETLARNGVRVSGEVRRDREAYARYEKAAADDKWAVLAIHETPLVTVLARTNKDSVNLYAEALCKRLGHEAENSPGTWENGTAAMGAFMKTIGVDAKAFHFDDGSGLSKENRISPDAITRVLAHAFRSKHRELYLSTLAVGGMDGTLDNRFAGSELRGRVFGKSGYVSGVSALSGYLKGQDEQWYAFSILFNGVPSGTNNVAKQLQERIVSAIDASTAANTVSSGR